MPRYKYIVLRYVPDIVRDEAVNVGILIQGLEGAPFQFRFLPRTAAIHKLDPKADETVVRKFEAQLRKAVRTKAPLDRFGSPTDLTFFERLDREFTGNLQITQVRGHVAEHPAAALNKLYTEFVAEPGAHPRPISYQALAPSRVRNRVWAAFNKQGLVRPGGYERFFTLEGEHAPWAFDLGLKNGHIEVINSIALSAASRETNLGRALVFRGMLEEVGKAQHPVEVRATAVIDRSEAFAAGFEESLNIIKDTGALPIEVEKVEELARYVAEQNPPGGIA